MEGIFCQSCGMPMGETDELYGTEADGSKSKCYCKYCYENGAFNGDYTMEDIIEMSVGPMVEANSGMSREQARAAMKEWFPTLERWKKK